MYHIFLTIAAIASQNQVAHVEKQFEERKAAYIRSAKGNHEEDIISELKKQAEAEEKAIKPDLESLGLDSVDVAAAAPKIPQLDPKTEARKEKDETEAAKTAAKNTNIAEVNLPDLSKNLPKEDKTKEVKFPPIPDVAAIVDKAADKTENQSDKKSLVDKVESKLKEIEKPIDKIKEIISKEVPAAVSAIENKIENKALPKEENQPKAVEKTDPVKVANENKVAEAKQKKADLEKKRRAQNLKKKRILADFRQQQKIKKLKELREKYLQKGEDEDVYEGVSHYQAMSKIIPQKKIPPKFLTSEVPPQLLNRFRGNDNKHHPLIMSNSEKIDFMFKAIAENRIDDFNSIFELVKNPNIKNSFGDTLLTFAILMGRQDAVSSLVSKGANPDLANDLGYTPLNIAIEMVDYRSVAILINIGYAKVDLVDDLGRTYLMQSSRVGSLPITDLLISKGVDVDAADNNGVTALAIAYKHKKDIIAKYLLKYGAKSWVKKDYIDDDTSMVEDLFNKWK
jgi:ankyrin repeat protein